MRYGLYPFVPMLVHEVVYDSSGRLVEVRINVFYAFTVFDLRHEQYVFLIRREHESVYVTVEIGNLFHAGTVRIHRPYGIVAIAVAQEGNLLASGYPCHIALVVVVFCYLPAVGAIGVHDEKFGIRAVFLYAVI